MDGPPKVLSKKPFLPSSSDREPVRPLDLHLRTDLRSEERRQYEQRRKDKEAEMEGARQQVRIHNLKYFVNKLSGTVIKEFYILAIFR